MAMYRLGDVWVDVSPAQERTIRADRTLAPGESLLEALRTEAWEALTAAGDETDHWRYVQVG